VNIADRLAYRLFGAFAAAERVFIRRQLDDVRLLQAEFARHLGNRLARLIRRDGAHV
jgi:hypothetical protein